MQHKYKFVNVAKLNKEHPNTIKTPSIDQNLNIGDTVKISNGKERFWVQLTHVKNNNLQGIIKNELLDETLYKYGDKVNFKTKNIYDILN